MDNLKLYLQEKKNNQSFRDRKTLECRVNGRSTDFIIPSFATGCPLVCHYCVSLDTLISTPKGKVRISDISDLQDVISYHIDKQLLQAHPCLKDLTRKVQSYFELKVDGNTLLLTGEHPVLTRRGWVEAQDLNYDDEVLCVQSDQ